MVGQVHWAARLAIIEQEDIALRAGNRLKSHNTAELAGCRGWQRRGRRRDLDHRLRLPAIAQSLQPAGEDKGQAQQKNSRRPGDSPAVDSRCFALPDHFGRIFSTNVEFR